ncbi:hypothetical protein ABZ635_04255 [Nocardiopsis sp. NPDC007018]|uniref:hypothetical protein n=1 Tax=Nocardiopsis sp. NPDC007018 TaxID=3155721 RepID=UPI003404EB4F
MSLAELEAYERERELRRRRVRLVLSWTPLGLAALLLASGGVAVWIASSGHEEDRAQVAVLVEELVEEADHAQSELHVNWVESLESSSTVRVERVQEDTERVHELLLSALEDGGAVPLDPTVPEEEETLAAFQDLADRGVPRLGSGAQASLGAFEPVVVGAESASYSYFAYVDVFDAGEVEEAAEEDDEEASARATLSVAWKTDYAGVITQLDVQWADQVPEES